MLTASPEKFHQFALQSIPRTIPIVVFSTAVVLLHRFYGLRLAVAALPISVMGIAIAFYVGFKNSQAYERFWEARTIWGGVVNTSRSWAIGVLDMVRPLDGDDGASKAIHRELVYRHLAWIHALRLTLRGETTAAEVVRPFLPEGEFEGLSKHPSLPLALLHRQSERIEELVAEGRVVGIVTHQDFRTSLRELVTQQGQCERIKNTPLVPHYTMAATLFVRIFVFLVPFALVEALADPTEWAVVPMSAIIGWMFDSMDRIGKYTEDPFSGTATDIPMTALCRNIERDLRGLLGETDLPPKLQAKDGVLD